MGCPARRIRALSQALMETAVAGFVGADRHERTPERRRDRPFSSFLAAHISQPSHVQGPNQAAMPANGSDQPFAKPRTGTTKSFIANP